MSQPIVVLLLLAVLSSTPLGCTAAGRGLKPALSTTSTATATTASSAGTPFRVICSGTRYSALCEKTLSATSLPTKTPTDLARATVAAALSSARAAVAVLTRSATPAASSANVCKERIANSVDKLSTALTELARLKPQTFSYQLDNANTWVSAAMTNADACVTIMGTVGGENAKRVSAISQYSSNALYFINRLATTKKAAGRSPHP